MNILILTRWCPLPLTNGSKLRTHSIVRGLARRHEVTLISFVGADERVSVEELRQLGVREVQLVPYRNYSPLRGRAIGGWFCPTPRSVVDTWSADLEHAVSAARRRRRYDVALASQIWTAAYYKSLTGIPSVLEELELGAFRDGHAEAPAFLRRLLNSVTWSKHRRFTARLVRKFVCCTVASGIEARLLRSIAPDYDRVRVVPNGIDLEECERVAVSREEGAMVFAGAVTFQPNYDAMKWFLAEIHPRIKARLPEARLTISGGGEWRDLPPARDVVRTGVVPDVRPVVASAAVSIAPIRFGAGTRLKVLEAMALRTPVVATTKAVEGLDVEHEKHLLVADTPDGFADAVIRVLCSPQLGCRLAENAFALVKQEYDWKVLEPKIVEVVEAAAQA